MDKQQVATGAVGIIALIATVLGTMYFTPDQLANTYYCNLTDEVGIFYGGLSGTGLTGYPYAENRSDYKRCQSGGTNGEWVKLTYYANANGIPVESLLEPTTPVATENSGVELKYICDEVKCEVIS